ncbi:PAS domain-containing protein [Caldimonas brevitalea]|uniref:histidine kinase n=1 Tax=Caldimonas brevitalea TaxID=413882 RepID=A0A0G3BDN7_9BURK|nr:PAS domain-containing protein [Caldimonas brevitalea]AKJ27397.1 histidine kinase [Caldimonas brevitalea]
MASPPSDDDADQPRPLDVQGDGQSAGVPAEGRQDKHTYNPVGNRGLHHWEEGHITRLGLGSRDNIFFALVEMTRIAMVVTDATAPDNPIAFVNRAFLDLVQAPESELIGRNCRFLQGEKTDPKSVQELREAVAAQRPAAVEILNYRPNGKPFWNALFIGPIFDADGRLRYWFGSLLDVTQRRLSEQSMQQAQKMEAIGQLTAGVAHDFNNLLHVIAGNLEIAKGLARHDEALTAALERAERATFQGGKLTQQLLTFARKQRLDPRQVNLNSLVIEFSEMLMRTVGERVELRLDLKPGLPCCTLDPVHLEMALLNVLVNARDAMPSGGTVTIGTALEPAMFDASHRAAKGGRRVVLCVRDQGVGMPGDVLARATEPFFTTKARGTGLGLAMVQGFVQQSRGELQIDSVPGEGTTIRMMFEAAEAVAVPAGAPTLQDGATAAGAVQDRPVVMLVEDSRDILALASETLDRMGCRVLCASSGEQAVELAAQSGRLDLLVTDVMMPGGMNGLALAAHLRARTPDLPVLLITGYMDELGQTDARNAYPVLTKPFRAAELARQVSAALAADTAH